MLTSIVCVSLSRKYKTCRHGVGVGNLKLYGNKHCDRHCVGVGNLKLRVNQELLFFGWRKKLNLLNICIIRRYKN